MGFSRPELNDDAIQWNRIQAQLESAEDHDPDEPLLVDGLVTHSDDEDDDGDADANDGEPRELTPSGGRRKARRSSDDEVDAEEQSPSVSPLPKLASPAVAAIRLPKIKAAAERVKKMKKVVIDTEKTHKPGKVVFDPEFQKFGQVLFSAPGYLRLGLRDGTEMTHGKPPLEDRRQFVIANFHRMDNKAMAEILEISVHTMRRLCHEYGLRRHGREQKRQLLRKSA